MGKDLAVVVIHGMGSQTPDFADATIHELGERLGADADRVAWQPIYWAPVLEQRELGYLAAATAKGHLGWSALRAFVVKALGDAVGYRQIPGDAPGKDTYAEVHAIVRQALAKLQDEQLGGRVVPLVVLAHSLGGHVLSNYIWDRQHEDPRPVGAAPRLEDCRTLAGMVTFGCNIPLFTFAYDDVVPIALPGPDAPANLAIGKRWRNFFDPQDVLGWPLQPLSQKYDLLVEDTAIDVGNLLTSWSPLAHQGYWTDNDFTKPVARFLADLLR